MTRLTDGKRTIVIRMAVWVDDHYMPDFENDFFEVGGLPREDDDFTTYFVNDVEYCIEQALDWKYGRGDYIDYDLDDDEFDPEDRMVMVDDVMLDDSWEPCDA